MANVFRNVAEMMIFRDSVDNYIKYLKYEIKHLNSLAEILQQGSADDDECKKAIKDLFELVEYLDEIVKFFNDVSSHYEEQIIKIGERFM
jgi:hypothetical protein